MACLVPESVVGFAVADWRDSGFDTVIALAVVVGKR